MQQQACRSGEHGPRQRALSYPLWAGSSDAANLGNTHPGRRERRGGRESERARRIRETRVRERGRKRRREKDKLRKAVQDNSGQVRRAVDISSLN